jgi:hypothetical protein
MDPYAAAGYGQPPNPFGPNPYGAYAGPTGQSMALVPVGMNPMLMGGGAIVPYGMGPFGGMPVAAGGLLCGESLALTACLIALWLAFCRSL